MADPKLDDDTNDDGGDRLRAGIGGALDDQGNDDGELSADDPLAKRDIDLKDEPKFGSSADL